MKINWLTILTTITRIDVTGVSKGKILQTSAKHWTNVTDVVPVLSRRVVVAGAVSADLGRRKWQTVLIMAMFGVNY